MNDAVRKLYEKENHAQQISYGPHLFFRTVTEVVETDGESPQKVSLPNVAELKASDVDLKESIISEDNSSPM